MSILNGQINTTTVYSLCGVTFAIGSGIAAYNPSDATTYYFGATRGIAETTTVNTRYIIVPKSGTVVSSSIVFVQQAGSNQTSTLYLRLNNTTDTIVSSSITNDSGITKFSNMGLLIPVVAGDTLEWKWTTPTWVTNPISVSCWWSITIQPT